MPTTLTIQSIICKIQNKIIGMQSRPKLISDAGRRYQKQHSTRPLNTANRLRMYNSIEVEPTHRSSNKVNRSTMQTVDRQQKDSFLLRHNRQMVVNTNYNINDEMLYPRSRRQEFLKGKFDRIIGDVRDQDFSLPLVDSCDKRCYDAFITLPHQTSIVTAKDIMRTRQRHHHLNFSKQVSREKLSQSLDMKKVNSIKSTQQSESYIEQRQNLKKRNKHKRNLELHDALKRIRNFEHDIGHKYGEQLFIPKNIPEAYEIEKSNQQLVKSSMSSPRGHIRFSSFRQKIATRYDRADPYWGMTLNYEHTHENPEWKSAKSINMQKISQRRLNEVFSKYPIRQTMQLVTPNNLSPNKSPIFQ